MDPKRAIVALRSGVGVGKERERAPVSPRESSVISRVCSPSLFSFCPGAMLQAPTQDTIRICVWWYEGAASDTQTHRYRYTSANCNCLRALAAVCLFAFCFYGFGEKTCCSSLDLLRIFKILLASSPQFSLAFSGCSSSARARTFLQFFSPGAILRNLWSFI